MPRVYQLTERHVFKIKDRGNLPPIPKDVYGMTWVFIVDKGRRIGRIVGTNLLVQCTSGMTKLGNDALRRWMGLSRDQMPYALGATKEHQVVVENGDVVMAAVFYDCWGDSPVTRTAVLKRRLARPKVRVSEPLI